MALREKRLSEIDPGQALKLLSQLDTVRTLPEAITRQRMRGGVLVRSCSAGKPWFDYDGYAGEEVKRIRIVEKWINGDESLHGTLLVMLQSIFPRPQDYGLDERTSAVAKLLFRSNGAVRGGTLKRHDLPQPYSDGAETSFSDHIIDFYWQQPTLEDDYRNSIVESKDVEHLSIDVEMFIEQEQELARIRTSFRNT